MVFGKPQVQFSAKLMEYLLWLVNCSFDEFICGPTKVIIYKCSTMRWTEGEHNGADTME